MFLIAALAASLAHAHDYRAGQVVVGHPYARGPSASPASHAVYLSLENKGTLADRLVHLSSPLAKAVRIHTMEKKGFAIALRPVDGLALPPAARIDIGPGSGYRILLLGLRKPLAAGDAVPLTLTFEKAGKADVSVLVEAGQTPQALALPARHAHK